MRVVIQRVSQARVVVDGEVVGAIGLGLVVLLGVSRDDTEKDAEYLAEKIAGLRVFPDDEGKLNRSVVDCNGALLVVSQFTLYGDIRKGRRPSFDAAAPPGRARELYEYFVQYCRKLVSHVGTGVFQARMKVELVNDGPVTIIHDTLKK